MQFFATDFPLAHGTTAVQIFEECLYWIAESPYTRFTQSDLLENTTIHEFTKNAPGECIEFEYSDDAHTSLHSFVYTKQDDEYAWITSVNFLTSLETGEAWVNVKATCNSFHAGTSIPAIKKPLIIIRLIDRYGGGFDGNLVVNHEHMELKDNLHDLELVANLINGETNNRLPIVLVTRYHSGHSAVIPSRLARSLSGLAHVIVEPNRNFSNKLRPIVNSQNIYGGAVGIYWPSDGGVSIYRKSSDIHVKAFENEIFQELRSIIAQRLPLRKCSLEALKELKNKKLIQKLKNEDSPDVNAYIEAFDLEIRAKDETIASLENEIRRLQSLTKSIRAKTPIQGGLHLNIGAEEDYFENEIYWIVLDALCDQKDRVHDNSRRLHVLQSMIESLHPEKLSLEITATIKEALRGYKEMTPKIRSTLTKLGFKISDDGKHLKLIYQDDDRYTFTLPKTGSDGRGGLNAASDISRLFF